MKKMSEQNLRDAFTGESFEVEEMYPAYDAVARQTAKEGRDIEIGDISICPVCGYTAKGDSPDACPVCGVSSVRFRKF